MESALHSIGQIAVTLAGFAALLKAFRRKDAADAHSEPRLKSIVEQGLVVVLLCFLPSLILSFGVDLEAAVRWVSAVAAVWLSRWLYILYMFRTADISAEIASLFPVTVVLHVAAFVAFLLSATGLIGSVEPLYFCGVVLTLTLVGLAFLAQFQSERS